MELEDSQPSEFVYDAKRVAPFIGALLLAAAGIVFAVREHNFAQTAAAQRQALADQNKQMTARLNETQDQVAALSAKVSSLTAPAPQTAASSSTGAVSGRRPAPGRAADPRFKKLQSQLDAQGKLIQSERGDIDSTRTDLASARTELTGSIARTHDELTVLEKKGELNYFEFDITKSRDFKHEGPLSVSLKKADSKHGFADLALIVDDRNLTQKHVNLYQPAMFYEPDSMRPIEIVINDISKNHIHGYVSAPRYRKSDLASASNNNANLAPGSDQAANSNTQPAPRKKLSLSNNDISNNQVDQQ
jgi:hypothetical protein